MGKITYYFKKLIPKNLLEKIRPAYHYALAFLGAVVYGFPSRKINIIAITGTKGKTSTTEIVNAILEEGGYKTAIAGTLRFKIGNESEKNLYKMTMPGRFFIQKFLRRAVKAGCQYAIVEMTSEGAKQFRHKFIDMDALIFTNLAPEHIESHGSYDNYVEAKLSIARALSNSKKKRKILVVNADDKEAGKFLEINVPEKHTFSLKDAEPLEIRNEGVTFTFDKVKINSPLSGKFNIYNMLGAAVYAKTQNISTEAIKRAIEKFKGIRGRVERIYLDSLDDAQGKQDFAVIVDYAHTPDSLEKLYEVFQNSKRICVLGNTGGGRDKWKRREMSLIAESNCSEIILTNEDPYDDDPRAIVEEMAGFMEEGRAEIIMDRREAINSALKRASIGDSVLISGKGTDPYIMGPKGTKIPWDDATVAREELKKIYPDTKRV